jgi:hypothetical protein
MVTAAVICACVWGAKVTRIVQLAPAARLDRQVWISGKSAM